MLFRSEAPVLFYNVCPCLYNNHENESYFLNGLFDAHVHVSVFCSPYLLQGHNTMCPRNSDQFYIVFILYKTGHHFLDIQ